MIRKFFYVSLLLLSLEARENPFFPSKGEEDLPYTSNQEEHLTPLRRATITLPSTARVLESVTIEYKNLDGSLATKSLKLSNSVDWHLPLFISQNINASEFEVGKSDSKKLQKKEEKYSKLLSLKFLKIYENARSIKIVTKDKLLRNFLLVKPHRIVCDFQREIDMRSYEKSLKKSHKVTKVKIGNHDGYYRVVMELDGYYKYETLQTKEGYVFKLF